MLLCFFFFKQKTAYEILRSDWSSDVCSSDLRSVVDGVGGGYRRAMETHTVALVLGAGGRVGGRFIGGALDELGRATGWRAEWADTVVGTSIGAIVGSRLDTAAADAAAVAALAELAEPVAPRVIDRPVAAARNLGGRLVAAVTPSGSRSPDELVAPRGEHPNVWVCSVRHRRPARRVASLAVAADPAAEVAASSAVPGVC